MKVKVNRRDFIEVENIEKLIDFPEGVRVYKKTGYPKVLKTRTSRYSFLLRLVNVGVSDEKIKELM